MKKLLTSLMLVCFSLGALSLTACGGPKKEYIPNEVCISTGQHNEVIEELTEPTPTEHGFYRQSCDTCGSGESGELHYGKNGPLYPFKECNEFYVQGMGHRKDAEPNSIYMDQKSVFNFDNPIEELAECTICGGDVYRTLPALNDTSVWTKSEEVAATFDTVGCTTYVSEKYGSFKVFSDKLFITEGTPYVYGNVKYYVQNGEKDIKVALATPDATEITVIEKVKAFHSNGEAGISPVKYHDLLRFNPSIKKVIFENVPSSNVLSEYVETVEIVNYDISDRGFYNRLSNAPSLKKVVIHEGVTAIGNYMFSMCEKLEEVVLPSTLTKIYDGAFNECYKLANITLPSGLTEIGNSAFSSSGLTEITIPDSVVKLGNSIFSNCKELATATIKGVDTIPEYTFSSCKKLTTVNLSTKVINVGMCAFSECEELSNIAGYTAFTSIGSNSFYRCLKLTSVALGVGLTAIPDSAFVACGFNSVNIPSTVETIGSRAFAGADIVSVVVPASVTALGENAFGDCTTLATVIISGDIGTINENTFKNCGELTTVEVYGNVYDVKENAFNNCGKLEKIVWLSSTSKESAFEYESSLLSKVTTQIVAQDVTSYVVPEYVTTIGADFFTGCTLLRELTIPATVKTIAQGALKPLTALEILNIDLTNKSSNMLSYFGGAYNFAFPTLFKTVNIIGGTEIPASYFANCSQLETITKASSITVIGSIAFANCTSLKSFDLTNVVDIRMQAFNNAGLESVIIPASIPYGKMANDAFANCLSLKTLIFARDAKVLLFSEHSNSSMFQGWSFQGCNAIEKIVIPENAIYVYTTAFSGSVPKVYTYNTYILFEFATPNALTESLDTRVPNKDEYYVYSENEPTDNNYNYWHFVNGEPTPWVVA